VKTSELSGALLDYWVARAEGIQHPRAMRELAPGFVMVTYESRDENGLITRYRAFEPSSNWVDGGHIIQRDHIGIMPSNARWVAWPSSELEARGFGETALIAAMRAKIWGHYGDEVPDEAMA